MKRFTAFSIAMALVYPVSSMADAGEDTANLLSSMGCLFSLVAATHEGHPGAVSQADLRCRNLALAQQRRREAQAAKVRGEAVSDRYEAGPMENENGSIEPGVEPLMCVEPPKVAIESASGYTGVTENGSPYTGYEIE